MGSSPSGMTKTFPISNYDDDDDEVTGVIDCNPYIAHSDIRLFIQRHQDFLLGIDRRVLQGCYDVLNQESDWVWRHARLEVYGRMLAVRFYSGDQSNKYVVCLNGMDHVSSQCVSRGLRLRLRDGFRSVFNWISGTGSRFIGALAGAGLRAITYF